MTVAGDVTLFFCHPPSAVSSYLGQANEAIKYLFSSHRPEEVTFNEERGFFFWFINVRYEFHMSGKCQEKID